MSEVANPSESHERTTITGAFRSPVQMLADQSYAGHGSVHDEAEAAKLGLAGAPIEGPTHFSQFEPLAASVWGDQWFAHGCISSHFQTMVIEGEQVQASLTRSSSSARSAQISAAKADGTPVLTGTASVGPDHGETELSARLRVAQERSLPTLHIIDQITIGLTGPSHVGTMDFDTHLGHLYPFTLGQKLAAITEHMDYHQRGAVTPWGASVVPFEMLSVLASSFSDTSAIRTRQPSLGLFIDLEVRVLGTPILVGKPYAVRWEIVGLGASKRTESYWTRFTIEDASTGTPCAEVLLHQGVFTASYPHYPTGA